MAADILIRIHHHEILNEVLLIIEDMCLTFANHVLVQLGMTTLSSEMHDLVDRELQREQKLNSHDWRLFVQTNITKYVYI